MSQHFDILYYLHYTVIDTLSGIYVTDLTLPKLLWRGREPKTGKVSASLAGREFIKFEKFFRQKSSKIIIFQISLKKILGLGAL